MNENKKINQTLRSLTSISEGITVEEQTIMDAKMELAEVEAALILAKNNDFGSHIQIGNIKVGICNNSKLIDALLHNKKEIKKFLSGKPNEWI